MEPKIRAIMRAMSWKQHQLAETLEVSQSTVNRWLAGSEPEGHRRDAINDLYDKVVEDAGIPNEEQHAVPVMGYIGAGAEIEPDFEQVPPEGLEQVYLPLPLPEGLIAFIVRGDSMLPFYKDGHVVIVWKEQKRPLEQFYGEDAVVRTFAGRRFLKTVERAINGVNLRSFNAPLIENQQLEWIGEIFATLPRMQLKFAAKKTVRAPTDADLVRRAQEVQSIPGGPAILDQFAEAVESQPNKSRKTDNGRT